FLVRLGKSMLKVQLGGIVPEAELVVIDTVAEGVAPVKAAPQVFMVLEVTVYNALGKGDGITVIQVIINAGSPKLEHRGAVAVALLVQEAGIPFQEAGPVGCAVSPVAVGVDHIIGKYVYLALADVDVTAAVVFITGADTGGHHT